MNLFDIIPENLFSVLASKNRNIYINALLIIKECYKQEMSMPKDEVAITIASRMEDEILQIQFEDSEYDEPAELETSSTEKAYAILRRLKWAGWIEFEIQGDNLEEYVILPDYAIDILNVLSSLLNKRNTEYNSYAYATYSTLKVALEENNNQIYTAVMVAYDNSTRLINSLKSLYNNLGRYYRKIIEKTEINSILEEHFGDYKEYIDKIYHPLKTDDPVNMYKVPITKMINKIIGDNITFDLLLEQAMKSGTYESEEKAKEDLFGKLFEIEDIYDNINRNIKTVDNKNSEYIIATTRKIGYLLTSDKEQKGRIINILRNAKKGDVIKLMQDYIQLLGQSYIDKSSIFLRNSKNEKKQGKPLEIEEVKIETDEELKEFMDKVGKSYTQEKVKVYMDNILKGKNTITTEELRIETDEDFILLMLGTMSEEKASYSIDYTNQYTKIGKYKIPQMIIKKREEYKNGATI